MKFYEKYKVGAEYKNFILVSIDDLHDFKAVGLYLRHKNTGLEVYHIINDDEENLFSFNFRTLAKNSYGAAHIMEHSVLCGSEYAVPATGQRDGTPSPPSSTPERRRTGTE